MSKDFKPYSITWYYIFQECFKKAGLLENGFFEKDEWALTLGPKIGALVLKHINENLQFKNDSEKKQYIQYVIGKPDQGETYLAFEDYNNYIRDRFNLVKNLINKGDYYEVRGFKKIKTEPLLWYAEIDDYDVINKFFYDNYIGSKFLIEKVVYMDEDGETIKQLVNFDAMPPEWLAPTSGIAGLEKYGRRKQKLNYSKIINSTGENFLKKEPDDTIEYPVKLPVVSILKPVKWYNLLPIPDEGILIFDEDGNCKYKGSYNISIKRDSIKGDAIAFANPRDPEPCWVKVNYSDGESSKTAYFAEPLAGPNSLKLAKPERLLALFNKKSSD